MSRIEDRFCRPRHGYLLPATALTYERKKLDGFDKLCVKSDLSFRNMSKSRPPNGLPGVTSGCF